MIIGTAGHIDHGKTALVKALTGIDADRLVEEKRRGITIELGFAYGDPGTGGLPGEIIGFIDVPGHERLVHTMVAGAGGVDAALLVVALDDGVMPQTAEHAAILELLGIDRGVVALTKADIAGDNIPAVTAELRSLFAGTGLANAAIIPVSVVTGVGIPALQGALRALRPRQRDRSGHPRLAVDRAFTLAGTGLVLTGTLVAGRIAEGDRLVLSPPGLELRVRGVHAQNRPAPAAEAGQRVALNVTGARLSKEAVTRGDWVLHPDVHAPTASLDAWLRVLPGEAVPLRAGTPVHLHLGAVHVMARVQPLDGDRVHPGDAGPVRLSLARPIGALARDRLVVRDAGASRTIGGGFVLDPFPPARGRRAPVRLAQLAALQEPSAEAALRGLLALPPGWTDRTRFLRAQNLPQTVAEAVQHAAPALPLADLLIAPRVLDDLQRAVAHALAAWHAEAPDQPGLQAERLRQRLPVRPPPEAYRALLDTLLRQGTIRQDGPWLRLAGHRLRLSAEDERLWSRVHALLQAERFRPPRTRDLAHALALPETAVRGMLKRLQRVGRVVEMAPDHFFLRDAVAEMAETAAALARDGSCTTLTVAAFRDRLDNGRKVAMEILEFFDHAGLTVRMGDTRRVRGERLALFTMTDAGEKRGDAPTLSDPG